MTTKKLTLMAILTAIALIIFMIEAQIPLPIPVPGVKLGLANAVSLFALFWGCQDRGTVHLSRQDARQMNRPPVFTLHLSYFNVLTILLCRIILGAVFTGRPIAFVYSLAGGLLAFAAQVVMMRFVSNKQIWVCGAVGAVFHNIGQITAAVLITGTPAIAAYLPVLIAVGVFTGVLTGLIAQCTVARLSGIDVNNHAKN